MIQRLPVKQINKQKIISEVQNSQPKRMEHSEIIFDSPWSQERRREGEERERDTEMKNMEWGLREADDLGDRVVWYPLSHLFSLLPTLGHSFVQLPMILIFAWVALNLSLSIHH